MSQRVFAAFSSADPRMPVMADYMAWYPRGDIPTMLAIGRERALRVAADLESKPIGFRTIHLRWLFRYEGYVRTMGSDPLPIFENGFVPTSNTIRMLRPLGRELRRRGIVPDAVFVDTEAGFSTGHLPMDQLRRIYASPRALARIPPAVRAINIDHLQFGAPNFRENNILFNSYANPLITRALKRALIDSGVFVFRVNGQRHVPPIVQYTGMAPTFPIFDPHGWQLPNTSVDGRTSNSFFYTISGANYHMRVHDWRWNALIDMVNWTRSVLNRPGALFWPLLDIPAVYHRSDWYFERIIAHLSRCGVNWENGNGWVWFNSGEPTPLGQGSAAKVLEVLDRHSGTWAPLRSGAQPIALDADEIETAGYRTTYTEFLANIPPA